MKGGAILVVEADHAHAELAVRALLETSAEGIHVVRDGADPSAPSTDRAGPGKRPSPPMTRRCARSASIWNSRGRTARHITSSMREG